MKTYVQPGDIITLIAPYAVLSGGGLLVGSIFGIAMSDALISSEVEVKTTGVFDLPKTTGQAWSQGARIYWDDTTKACTTTASTNKLIGVATAAALSADAVGRVLLTGAFTL